MTASTYVEFLFWRLVRYRRVHLKKLDGNSEHFDSESGNTYAYNDNGDSGFKRLLQVCVGGRRKFVIAVFAVLSVEFGFLLTYPPNVDDYFVFDICLAMTFVLFRAVILKRLYQLLRWRYWLGIIVGLVTGPLFLVMHIFETIRRSDKQGEFMDGSNIGFAGLAMLVHILLTRYLGWKAYVWNSFIFAWMLSILVFLTHAIRCTTKYKMHWKFSFHGFVLGLFFGPFGLLF